MLGLTLAAYVLAERKRLVSSGALIGVAFAINLLAVKVVADLFTTHRLLTSLAGTPLYVVAFYLLCEYWVFRRHPSGVDG